MKSSRKERIGWYMYDWANSAFYTTVITVFLGPYLTSIAANAADKYGLLHIFGIPVYSGSYFPYLISISVILQVIILPITGAIADYTNYKKQIMTLFAYIGAFSTMGLYFLEGTRYILGGILFIIANLAFGVSAVIYNSFLNDIAEPEERDSVSSVGWAIGYIGGGLVLAFNLLLIYKAKALGISMEMAVRISLCSAGAWWAIFTLFPLINLRNPIRPGKPRNQYLLSGFRQLGNTIRNITNYPKTILFLVSYLLFNDGVQSVIALSAVYGHEQMKIDMETLTLVILVVQFVAFGGALLFNFAAKYINAKGAIIACLIIWILVLFYLFFFLTSSYEFYVLAFIIALVLGGTQALSRSLYSLLIPNGREAEYFSLYEVSERGTSWMGPLVFALALQYTRSYNLAVFSLIIFFVAGLFLLLFLNVRKAVEEVHPIPENV